MASIDCGNFSASDLQLFIESIEKITNVERIKHERQLQLRAEYLSNTLRYLEQQYPASNSSSATSSTENLVEGEENVIDIEEKTICYHYAVNDIIFNGPWQNDDKDSNQYYEAINGNGNNDISGSYESASLPSITSSDFYENVSTIDSSTASYEEPLEISAKISLKKRLLDLMRQHCLKQAKSTL